MKEQIQEKLNVLELNLENMLNQLVGLKTLNESLKGKLKDKENIETLGNVEASQSGLNLSEIHKKIENLVERVDRLIQSIQKNGI